MEIFLLNKVHLEETNLLFYKCVHQSQNNNKIIKADEILQTSMLCVELLEQTELLITLRTATFTIKVKSTGKNRIDFKNLTVT